MKCPYCQSDNLIHIEPNPNQSILERTDNCCEDCGCSFQIIQEPQDILLKGALEKREAEKEEEKNDG
ncbi:hypothetical protein N9948_02070 [bacterium]|nr:hypothetical protein [bacterium]